MQQLPNFLFAKIRAKARGEPTPFIEAYIEIQQSARPAGYKSGAY